MHPDLSNSLLSSLKEGVHIYVMHVCVSVFYLSV